MLPQLASRSYSYWQWIAASLLLAFLAQSVWLVHMELAGHQPPNAPEAIRISEGWKQWHGKGIAGAPFLDTRGELLQDPFIGDASGFDTEHSPLLSLASAAPLLLWPRDFDAESSSYWRWLPRIPFLACGLFLGASLWYVARRLCGNNGGLIALALYAFSPSMIQASAAWNFDPEIVAAWGVFGTIFTAIALAHTLYAPREVVLWNWRRILLLGIALAIAVGAQFGLVVVALLALGFLLYVAPVRRGAAVIIWLAACFVGVILLCGEYFFHFHTIAQSLKHADFWGATWRGFALPSIYKQIAMQIGRACPAMAILLPVSIATYAAWPRTRYFGNTGPFLTALLLILLTIAYPYHGSSEFLLAAIPFLFLFVSGILADLLETGYRPLVAACIGALLLTYIARTLMALALVPLG